MFQRLIELDSHLKKSTKKGYQPGTSKNLRCQINRYLDFCLLYKLPPVPGDELQLRRFAQFLYETPSVNAYGTLENYMSSLKTFHRMVGVEPPSTQTFLASLTLKGLRLEMAQPVKQARPITPEILQKIFKHVKLNNQEQLTVWVVVLFTFHLLLRKSNLVPDSQNKFDPAHQFTRGSLVLAKNAMLAEVVWCKTLQYQQKRLPLPLVRLQDMDICPIRWTWEMIRVIPAKSYQPLFCYHRDGEFMYLTYPWWTTVFHEWLEKAGYDKMEFSSHSFRRGGSTYLHEADVPGQIIKLLGNWASKCYLRYVDITLNRRVDTVCEIAQLLAQ